MTRIFNHNNTNYSICTYGDGEHITLRRWNEKGDKTITFRVVYNGEYAWKKGRGHTIYSCRNADDLAKDWARCIDEKFMMFPVYDFIDKIVK